LDHIGLPSKFFGAAFHVQAQGAEQRSRVEHERVFGKGILGVWVLLRSRQ